MSKSIEWPVLLMVRGTPLPKSLEEMRVVHNDTAGSPQGIAAARSLGDLSHMVYAPLSATGQKSGGAEAAMFAEEVMFMDVWVHPKGIMDFFANENVVQQGTKLFTSRDATVWMPAEGSYSYTLPAPRAKTERYVGIVRGPVASPAASIDIFRAADIAGQQEARRRGLLSHQLFIKMNAPDGTAPLELLGVDVWNDLAGMNEHYGDAKHMAPLAKAFTGRPDTSRWEQAPGQWSEW